VAAQGNLAANPKYAIAEMCASTSNRGVDRCATHAEAKVSLAAQVRAWTATSVAVEARKGIPASDASSFSFWPDTPRLAGFACFLQQL